MSSIITITNHPEPIRLDRFLRKYFTGITQGLIEQALRKQQITVNDLKANANLRISNTDVITIAANFKFIAIQEIIKKPSAAAKQLAADLLGKYKVFADEHILVINKPAGLAVQGGSKIKLSINDALEYLNLEYSKGENPSALAEDCNNYKISHRLDKETSGLLLIAKGRSAANIIADAFKKRLVKKTYLAVLSNIPNTNDGTGVIESYIGKSDSKHYQQVIEDHINGKLAITNYKIIKIIGQQALVEFQPLTGRMHQLRFHSQAINCSIVGDKKYGFVNNKSTLSEFKNNDLNTGNLNATTDSSTDRLLLHAYKLSLAEHLFNKTHNFTVDTPAYWAKFM